MAAAAKRTRAPKEQKPDTSLAKYSSALHYVQSYQKLLTLASLVKRVQALTSAEVPVKGLKTAENVAAWLESTAQRDATKRNPMMVGYIAQGSMHLAITSRILPFIADAKKQPNGEATWTPRLKQILYWKDEFEKGAEPYPTWFNAAIKALGDWSREVKGEEPRKVWTKESEAAAKAAAKAAKAEGKKAPAKKKTTKKAAEPKETVKSKVYTEGDYTLRKQGTLSGSWVLSHAAKGDLKETFKTLKEARAFAKANPNPTKKAKKPAAKTPVKKAKAPAKKAATKAKAKAPAKKAAAKKSKKKTA